MTVAAGATVDATDIVDLQGKTTGRPLVKLIQQVAQTGITTGSDTVLTFGSGSEDIDTHGYHDTATNNSRVTPQLAGYYRLTVRPILAFNTTTTAGHGFVRKNGTIVERGGNSKPTGTVNVNVGLGEFSTILSANGTTDYFEAGFQVTATANQATNVTAGSASVFIVEFIRPL